MSKGMNQAEAFDRFLDDLIVDPSATPPEDVDTASAATMRAMVAVERPVSDVESLSYAQARVWNRVMAVTSDRQTEGERTRQTWLSWRLSLPRLAVVATAMLLLVALGSFAIFGGTERANAAEILSRAEKVAGNKAVSGLTSYKGTIRGTSTEGSTGIRVVYRQEVLFQAPASDRTEMYMEELVMPTPGPQETPAVTAPLAEGPSIYVSDGHTAWGYNPEMNMAVQYDPGTLDYTTPEFGASSLASLLSAANEEYEASLVGSDVITSRETHVIELVPKEGTYGAQLWTRRTLWIDKGTYLTLKEVDRDERFNRDNTWEFTHLEINVPLDSSLFTFTPPPGAEIVDGRPKPAPTEAEMAQAYEELAARVPFQLYRPTYLPAKLKPQLPDQEPIASDSVMLKFSSKASLTALMIFQSEPGIPFEGNNGDVVQAGPYTGRYLERDFIRMLVLQIGNTEVLLQGQAEVTKADLLEIAASLQAVENK
jgi:outer membrane lipoprotein-sorting protein